jgi:hypothetical protein
VWIVIEGHEKKTRNEWEMVRAICFNVAMFGNSDPKKMPRKPQKFMPFSWDQPGEDILTAHARRKALREKLEKQQNADRRRNDSKVQRGRE